MTEVAPVWPELSWSEIAAIWGVTVGSFIACVIVLGYLWPPSQNYTQTKKKTQKDYGSAESESGGAGDVESDKSNGATETTGLLEAGEVGGTYDMEWTQTFDFVFLIGMSAFLVVLAVLTTLFKPQLWTNLQFWTLQLPKVGLMMGVSLIGGAMARYFCQLDEKNYIITNKTSAFKVNYTRKIQHFAAYTLPLWIKPTPACNCDGSLELAWGDWVTLLGFLVLIKPIRENSTFFMLQFNSLDRPEDRPDTLKWIIGGNIVPGQMLIVIMRWAFGFTNQADLALIPLYITGIGDGLAEPIGIAFGKHKYMTKAMFASAADRAYTRSYEGSACVFISGLLFTALQWYSFHNATQFWLCMLLIPPAMTFAEAKSPHTLDTPFLMAIGGLLIQAIISSA